jgi:hypothetical protein
MKRLGHILILLILISSCKSNQQHKKLDCDYIEITYDNGWTGGSTMRINKDLTYKKCFYHIISSIDNCSCFTDTLSDKYYGRINLMIDSLKNVAIDSIYDGNCQDCGGFIIRIKYPDRILKTMIIGSHRFNNRIANFARFICDMPISKYHPDSCKIFETTKYLIPPPMKFNGKFVPPTDNEIDK